ILNQISTFYPLNNSDCEDLFDTCIASFENCASIVRKKIIELFLEFVERNGFERSRLQKVANSLINSLCSGVLNDECTIDVLHFLHVAANSDCSLSFDNDFYITLKSILESARWQIRKWSLNLYTCLILSQENLSSDKVERLSFALPSAVDQRKDLENVLMQFLEDCDSRVRITAADNLV
uniref:HEAT repeat-containing protein 1 n=1 Tax=Romanomermis culicivorax TaxID=13658 RepID=A0A915L847_ROMCU